MQKPRIKCEWCSKRFKENELKSCEGMLVCKKCKEEIEDAKL
jgi:formylmethanofuran dehydrogenase subunit E